MKSHPVPCRSRCSRGFIHGLLALSLAGIIAFAGSAGAQSLSLSGATIADLNAAFDAGSLTSERLVTLYLARIEAYDDDGLGIGTDTGGSVRGPTTSNGIAGLKPTLGLLSRDGIVPLALSFDTAGPMARSVYDVAAMLSVMVGVDPADDATAASEGRYPADYTGVLDEGALAGARIGIARDFLGYDTEVTPALPGETIPR